MAVARKPNITKADLDAKAQQFIAGAPGPQLPATIPEPKAKSRALVPAPVENVQVTVRFSPEMVARIDAAAKRRGVNRSAFIKYSLSLTLEEEEMSLVKSTTRSAK